jgi:hypothetical protein
MFIILSIVWWVIQRQGERNKKHEDGTSDAKDAIKKHDTAGLFASIRKRLLHR